jgi:CheY-like chemotaxis protein/anti-sigma regulatory factor (Ser/Thr protein kinase)
MTTRILVVDDSPVERRLVGRLLEKGIPGVTVLNADDGNAALQSIASAVPDLILSDLRMPGMNGLELVESIKLQGLGVPVILMTSYGNEQIAVEALKAGAASYVPKLVLDTHLISTVKSVLSLALRQSNRQRIMGTLDFLEVRFVLENDTSLIPPLIAYVQEQIAVMRLSDDSQLTRIGVAIHESLTNAIYHGNLELSSELRQEDESIFHALAEERRRDDRYALRRARLAARLSAAEVRVVIQDDGPGFDPMQVRNPTAAINMDRIGGRGLLLVRSFMDDVRHNPQGNEITMVKHVSPNPADLQHAVADP